MIKFVIGFIALIFVGLAVYVYTGKKSEEPIKSTVTHNVVKKEVTEKKVVSVVKEVKIKSKKIAEIDIIEKDLLRISKLSNNQKDTSLGNEVGENLTLESIENTDVSDREKDKMIDDMVYNQSLHVESAPTLPEEEILKIMINDLENGKL